MRSTEDLHKVVSVNLDADPRSSPKPLVDRHRPRCRFFGRGDPAVSLVVRICSAGRVHAGLDRVGIGVCVQSGDHGTPNALASFTDCEHVRPGDRDLYRRGGLYRMVWTVDGPASSNAGEENAPVRSKPQHTLWNSIGRSFHPAGGLRIKAPEQSDEYPSLSPGWNQAGLRYDRRHYGVRARDGIGPIYFFFALQFDRLADHSLLAVR